MSVENEAVGVDTIDSVIVTYDMPIYVPTVHSVKVNNTYADSVKVQNSNELVIYFNTVGNTSYTVTINKPTVHNGNFAYAPSSAFSFKTKIINTFDASAFNIDKNLCNPDATDEAKALYFYLRSMYGKQTLSATMASPAWNTITADTLYTLTGKYPAIHSFDFIHLRWSRPLSNSNWIDYMNTTVVENWVKNGGIVAAGWHWNVPKTEADKYNLNNYAFYSSGDMTFTAKLAVRTTSWMNTQINEDLDALSQILLQLQDKGIALLWRPLHEASGSDNNQWFWWGTSGAVQYKKLWIYMYNYLKEKGVNNLIWVWTSQGTTAPNGDDSNWYPGDEYVDIISHDCYKIENHESIKEEFDKLREITNGKKMIALSECGQIPSIDNMLSNGDVWSWFMPWNGEFMTEKYNSKAFFNEMMNSECVITRDELPTDLKAYMEENKK
jgi:mannan endo-1,4-beta-mannosidase